MAASKTYSARPSYRFLSTEPPIAAASADAVFELDEFDIYAPRSDSPEFHRTALTSRLGKKSSKRNDSGERSAAGSAPVNVPDWSKILRGEYRESRRRDGAFEDELDGGESDGGGARVPPHEFLASRRMASFSVHEGIGRTLKGRDLSRVRNAIWQKTGFED